MSSRTRLLAMLGSPILMLVLAVSSAVALEPPATGPTDHNGTKLSDADSRFSITVPEDWVRAEGDRGGFINVTGPSQPTDPRKPIITATGYPVSRLGPNVKTLEDYQRLEMENFRRIGAKLSDPTDATLAGIPAKRYILELPERETISISIVTIKDEVLFGIAFEATPEQCKRLSDQVDQIVASFRITGKD